MLNGMGMLAQLHDLRYGFEESEPVYLYGHSFPAADQPKVHVLRDKLEIPPCPDLVARPRLTGLLKRSLSRSSAALISGRSGTGKTTIAAEYALNAGEVGWLSVDSADRSWPIFSAHFAAAITGNDVLQIPRTDEVSEAAIENFLLSVCAEAIDTELIVLDDLHHLFDAPWFNTFFTLLISSIKFRPHLLMTSRSRPPSALWRMRSKQALEVIDEKLLDFNLSETQQLFVHRGIEQEAADSTHSKGVGRASQVLQAAQQYHLDLQLA